VSPEQLPPTGTSGSVFPPAGTASGSGVGTAEPLTDHAATHPFDQTNGLVDAAGDSDGTAASDTRSAAEREDKSDKAPGTIPPNLAAGNTGQ
jgi:hypothetical protein